MLLLQKTLRQKFSRVTLPLKGHFGNKTMKYSFTNDVLAIQSSANIKNNSPCQKQRIVDDRKTDQPYGFAIEHHKCLILVNKVY